MSSAKNKEVVSRLLGEVFGRGELRAARGAAAEQLAAPFAAHLVPAAFPDFRLSVEQMIADGDRVVVLATFSGTHRGAFLGVAPTGRSVSARWTGVFRLAGGRVVEQRQNFDLRGLRQQLGPERAAAAEGGPPEEPVLEVEEIQGNVLLGFDTLHQTLLFLEITDAADARAWLGRLAPRVTSVARLLAFKRRPAAAPPPVWLNIAFTYQGLRKLTDEAELFTDVAFKEGMPHRSVLLGDPTDPAAEAFCGNWVIGGPGRVPDIMLIVAGDDRGRHEDEVRDIKAGLGPGLRLLFEQRGAVLPPPLDGCEHFGYRDNISQPGIRGRISRRPDDFLTPRLNPQDPNQGLPGQNVIWPGEFVFGYRRQDSMDKWRPGPLAEGGPAWARNGSFLVFRRLRQHVGAFHDFIRSAAAVLAERSPLFAGVTPEKVAAKLMGRWPSGAPILRAPDSDDAPLAADSYANNHFKFIEGCGPLGRGGHSAADPASADDALGLICPHAAHIRRAYPRDEAAADVCEASIETHRLLRRGIPFGDPYPSPGERGLLFLAYQTSFERQFEFVTRAWLNNPNLLDSGNGYDPITGQNTEGDGARARTFTLAVPNPDGTTSKIRLDLPTEWVTPTGGGYFFAPSASALRHLAAPPADGRRPPSAAGPTA